MFNYLPLQWVFLFFFYSFFGWCFESTYVSFLHKKPVNRGFMRGPFLPLYGCGGIMMLIVSKPYYDNLVLVYIAGCIGATALEFVTGVLMETLFKVRYWDYSDKFLNYKGQICLESTLVWGFFTVLFTHFLQLPIERLVLSIPYNVISIVTIILVFTNGCDFMLAFRTALDIRDVLVYMEKAKEEMNRIQKRMDVIIAFKGEEVMDNISNSAIGSKVGDIGAGIANRIDVLSLSIENSFDSFKEKISLDPTAYVENVKEEVGELYTKYRVLMERLTPSPIKNFYDWYRNRTLIDNPNMVSKRFKNSLEEIKERANNKRK